MGSQERSIHVSKSGCKDVHEALAWAVQSYDKEFTEADMVTIHVQNTKVLTGNSEEWKDNWTASVSGLVEQSDED